MWPRPQLHPCLTHSCETRSSQCTTGLGTRMVQLVMYQHPTFPSSLVQSLFISSRSFTQPEVAGLILATGTCQCCQSRLTETWTATGQHSWPKENRASWMVFLRVSTVPNHLLSNSEPQRWVHQYLLTTYYTVSSSTSQTCVFQSGFNQYEKAFPPGCCYYSMDLL